MLLKSNTFFYWPRVQANTSSYIISHISGLVQNYSISIANAYEKCCAIFFKWNKTVWIWVQVQLHLSGADEFTHWGRVTHICVGKLTIIASDYGLSPVRHQAIIWTNAGILLIQTLGTNISEILSEIHKFAFKEMHLKMSSGKWWPFCLGLNMLTLNVRGPIYLGFTRSISWLLMPWLHTSPGHQQPWYWPCRICRSWSYLRKDFKYMCRINED